MSTAPTKTKLFLTLLSINLLATFASKSIPNTPSHSIVLQSCTSTLYPELCFASITSNASLVESISSPKDVIISSIHLAKTAVRHVYSNVTKLNSGPHLTETEKYALHDCLVMIEETIDELDEAEEDLKLYPKGKTLSQHAADLKTLLSATITNQESCIDGFSHSATCRGLRQQILAGVTHVSHMCSNSLAMICNLTSSDMAAASAGGSRKLLEEKNQENIVYEVDESTGFPTWMSTGDRRLLQSGSVTANTVVAADGSGNFKTVSAAVAAAPENSKRYVIHIKAGVYNENVDVPKKKINIMFMGDGRGKTVITGRRNVVDGSTTFHSATVAVVGNGFIARDMTIQNTAGPSKHQAVALRVGSDLSAIYQCDILGYQDTLYVHSLRQFYRNCLVTGTVDFIFGNAAVVLQSCDLQARRPNANQKNMFTAQGREDPNQNTGISILGCNLRASGDLAPVQSSFPTYLGRPWKKYSRTVILKSTIGSLVNPKGWFEWDGNFALDTLYYGEYANTGPGAATGGRVTWKGYRVITNVAEAGKFTVGNFLGGAGWLGATGVPFTLGL